MMWFRKRRQVDQPSETAIFPETMTEVQPSIFLRMPRAGSTSISSIGIPNCQVSGGKSEGFWGGTLHESYPPAKDFPHKRLWEAAKSRVGEQSWELALKFTSVRNPWDRAVSMWRHPACGGGSFRDFCERLQDTEFSPAGRWHVQGMFFHLADDSGNLVVDFVIRMEHAQEDVDRLCNTLMIPTVQLPHRASSNREHYSTYYDDVSRKIIEDVYDDDIREFGYSFA